MPYLHLDLPGTYPVEVKRELATRLCKLYADLMETQSWRPNVGIAEKNIDFILTVGTHGLNLPAELLPKTVEHCGRCCGH